MTYLELEQIASEWRGRVCIFGAGLIGRTWGYTIINAAGFSVDCYIDNNINAGICVRNGIFSASLSWLVNNKSNTLVFLTVSDKFQNDLVKQISEMGIDNIICIDDEFGQKFYESIEKSGNYEIIKKYSGFMNDEKYLKQRYEHIMNYPIDFIEPKTFNEKLNWLKINDRRSIYSIMADKAAAKEFIAERIGEEFVVPLYGIWKDANEIDFSNLPSSYVLKSTNDSGGVVICKNRNLADLEGTIRKLEKSRRTNYYLYNREWAYKGVSHRILAEQYLEELDTLKHGVIDYKIHCFMGVPKIIQVICDRNREAGTAKEAFFDTNWKRLDWSFEDFAEMENDLSIPKNLECMLQKSKLLARNMRYLRVDWYSDESSAYVGELTFYPEGGMYKYCKTWTYERDLQLGQLIEL